MTRAWLPEDLTSSNKVTPGFQIWLEPQFSQKKSGTKGFLLPGYQAHLKLSLIEISVRLTWFKYK